MDKEISDIVEKSVVKRGRPKGSTGNQRPDSSIQPAEPGANREILKKTLRLWKLPKIDMNSVDQVEKRIDEYFDICAQEDMKPSVEGLAFALGISRQHLYEVRVGNRGKNKEVSDLLKRASEMLGMALVEYMQNGKINPIPALFLLKNNHGYADKQEVVITPAAPLGDATDTKALEDRYVDSVVIDDPGDVES